MTQVMLNQVNNMKTTPAKLSSSSNKTVPVRAERFIWFFSRRSINLRQSRPEKIPVRFDCKKGLKNMLQTKSPDDSKFVCESSGLFRMQE